MHHETYAAIKANLVSSHSPEVAAKAQLFRQASSAVSATQCKANSGLCGVSVRVAIEKTET